MHCSCGGSTLTLQVGINPSCQRAKGSFSSWSCHRVSKTRTAADDHASCGDTAMSRRRNMFVMSLVVLNSPCLVKAPAGALDNFPVPSCQRSPKTRTAGQFAAESSVGRHFNVQDPQTGLCAKSTHGAISHSRNMQNLAHRRGGLSN